MTLGSTRSAKGPVRQHVPATRLRKQLKRFLPLGFAAVLCFSPLQAGVPSRESYRLAAGDKISVTVYGQAELSGDVLIDGAGNILLPLVGEIQVKDLTFAECQQRIFELLANGILKQPVVSVRASELRPVYILGDVRLPGSYPFRYGSTVKSILAVAGGFGISESGRPIAVSEFLMADQRLSELGLQRQSLLVRLARIEAQRDRKSTFSPPALPEIAEGDEVADVVAIETETFEMQKQIMQSQLDLLGAQKPRMAREVEALNGQITATKTQIELMRQQVERYDQMLRQGLGRSSTEFELKLGQARHQSDLWKLTAELSRLQMVSGEIDLKMHEVDVTFRKQVAVELQDARRHLKEMEITLPIAREMRQVKLLQTGEPAATDVTRAINITRTRNGAASVVQATETMVLEPGDIIDVKKLIPWSGSRPHQSATIPARLPAGPKMSGVRERSGQPRLSAGANAGPPVPVAADGATQERAAAGRRSR